MVVCTLHYFAIDATKLLYHRHRLSCGSSKVSMPTKTVSGEIIMIQPAPNVSWRFCLKRVFFFIYKLITAFEPPATYRQSE